MIDTWHFFLLELFAQIATNCTVMSVGTHDSGVQDFTGKSSAVVVPISVTRWQIVAAWYTLSRPRRFGLILVLEKCLVESCSSSREEHTTVPSCRSQSSISRQLSWIVDFPINVWVILCQALFPLISTCCICMALNHFP